MKKGALSLILTFCLLTGATLIPVSAAEPVLTDFPTDCVHTVVSKGHYSNWSGVSSVSQFADENENFCFAVAGEGQVSVYKTENGKVTKTVTIANPYSSFGAATCGPDGSLYMVWGYNNDSDDKSVQTIIVGKYTSEGAFVASAGGNGKEGMAYYYDESFYTKTPFDGGNCDVAMNGDLLMVNYARHMYSGHQANTVFAVDTTTMTVKEGFVEYNSHSFDQRITPYSKTGGFLIQSQGDCFPRSFSTTLTDAEKNLNQMDTFNFWVEQNAFKDYDMYKLNVTRAKLGNILETSSGAVLIGSSARSLSEAAKTEPYDLFVQAFDPTGSAANADSYVTKGVRSGLAGNNGDTEVTDYGVFWLTNFGTSGQTAQVVQAVSIDNDQIAVLYELYQGSSYDSTWYMILNGDGSIARNATSLGKVRLNLDEDPVFAQGAVQWMSNQSGSQNLVLHSLNFNPGESLPNGYFGNDNELKWTLNGDVVTVTGPFGATAPVIAACYDANGVMIGAEFLANSGDGASAPDNAASMKLFWVDSVWAPKCLPTAVPIGAAA